MYVELLCGMIASGKSTYSAYRASQGAIIIDHDIITSGLHGGRYDLYSEELKPTYKSIELAMFTTALLSGRSVVVDRTFHRRAQRHRFISIAKAYDLPVHCTMFPKLAPEIHATRRFAGNSRGLSYGTWLKAAEQHEQDWEEPTLQEGFNFIGPVPEII